MRILEKLGQRMEHASLSQTTSKDIFIASIAILGIFLHLLFRFIFVTSEFVQLLPLYAVLLIGGLPLVYDLLLNVIHLEFSSDLLAGISIVTAILLQQYLAGSLVVLMLSGGQTLELYAVRKASSLLEALAKRMPSIAHRKREGTIHDVAISEINVKDVVVIYPHEICPVDGVVLDGHGVMDESYLTGEPFFISKAPGVNVLSGAINGDTLLVVEATHKAVDSRYAKIMQVMIESEQKKPRIRRLGDQLGAYYTPLSLLIAGLAWVISGDPVRFLAVLVIATPCPLLIAIPVAVIGAISLSARKGIIIKNPAILEQIDKCRTMIFDKTGTLTYGKPAVTEVTYFNHLNPKEILGLTASVERYSKHPLSSAILEEAKKENVLYEEASEIRERPGEGLKGSVKGYSVIVTSRAKLLKQHQEILANRLPKESGLECVVLIDHQLAAHFRFHDQPRLNSRSFIAHLNPVHQFDKIMIISGDREVEVRYLAQQVGISEIYANKTPEEKVKIVENETKKGQVIYLGDGINDAPALAVATVGLAFGQNSDIPSEAADAVIMDNTLEKVDDLLHISRRMRRIALESAVGGMALSLLGMFVAAFGFLTPVMGAISQEIIDVFAVLNALRVAVMPSKLSDFD